MLNNSGFFSPKIAFLPVKVLDLAAVGRSQTFGKRHAADTAGLCQGDLMGSSRRSSTVQTLMQVASTGRVPASSDLCLILDSAVCMSLGQGYHCNCLVWSIANIATATVLIQN